MLHSETEITEHKVFKENKQSCKENKLSAESYKVKLKEQKTIDQGFRPSEDNQEK